MSKPSGAYVAVPTKTRAHDDGSVKPSLANPSKVRRENSAHRSVHFRHLAAMAVSATVLFLVLGPFKCDHGGHRDHDGYGERHHNQDRDGEPLHQHDSQDHHSMPPDAIHEHGVRGWRNGWTYYHGKHSDSRSHGPHHPSHSGKSGPHRSHHPSHSGNGPHHHPDVWAHGGPPDLRPPSGDSSSDERAEFGKLSIKGKSKSKKSKSKSKKSKKSKSKSKKSKSKSKKSKSKSKKSKKPKRKSDSKTKSNSNEDVDDLEDAFDFATQEATEDCLACLGQFEMQWCKEVTGIGWCGPVGSFGCDEGTRPPVTEAEDCPVTEELSKLMEMEGQDAFVQEERIEEP